MASGRVPIATRIFILMFPVLQLALTVRPEAHALREPCACKQAGKHGVSIRVAPPRNTARFLIDAVEPLKTGALYSFGRARDVTREYVMLPPTPHNEEYSAYRGAYGETFLFAASASR